MSFPKSDNVRDNEQNKFINDSKGKVAVNTVSEIEFPSGAFSDLTGSNPTIYNVNMPVANTEYMQALPVGVNKIRLKIRNNLSKFDISYTSSGNTWSVPRGTVYQEDGLNLENITNIYFKSNNDNMVMEIIVWV